MNLEYELKFSIYKGNENITRQLVQYIDIMIFRNQGQKVLSSNTNMGSEDGIDFVQVTVSESSSIKIGFNLKEYGYVLYFPSPLERRPGHYHLQVNNFIRIPKENFSSFFNFDVIYSISGLNREVFDPEDHTKLLYRIFKVKTGESGEFTRFRKNVFSGKQFTKVLLAAWQRLPYELTPNLFRELRETNVDILLDQDDSSFELNNNTTIPADQINEDFFNQYEKIVFWGFSKALDIFDSGTCTKEVRIIENNIVVLVGRDPLGPYKKKYTIYSFYDDIPKIEDYYRQYFNNPKTRIKYNHYQTNFDIYKPYIVEEKLYDFCFFGFRRRDFDLFGEYCGNHPHQKGLVVLRYDFPLENELDRKIVEQLIRIKKEHQDKLTFIPFMTPVLCTRILSLCKVITIPLIEDHDFAGYSTFALAIPSGVPVLTSFNENHTFYNSLMHFYTAGDYASFEEKMEYLIRGGEAVDQFCKQALAAAQESMDIKKLILNVLE
ncbi:MAG: hypothetical protein GY754_19495 [bacterium]|nr:hypothetical protein [bacterium]